MDQTDTSLSEDGTVSSADDSSSATSPLVTAESPEKSVGSITWTANEFIAHPKSIKWYLKLCLVALIIAAILWVLTKDVITAGAIFAAAIILAVYGAKKPHSQEYGLDSEGIHIGQRLLPFGQFRSFTIAKQGDFTSLNLFPLKRFSLLTTIYFDPTDEAKIVSIISLYLPLQEKNRDVIDDFLWRIRF